MITDYAIEMYPNPVGDRLTVNGDGIQHVRLFTVTGTCVYEKTVKRNKIEIDMASLPHGLYFLNVQTEKGIVVRKLVKE